MCIWAALPAEARTVQSEEEPGRKKTLNAYYRYNWLTPAASNPTSAGQQVMKGFQHNIHKKKILTDRT